MNLYINNIKYNRLFHIDPCDKKKKELIINYVTIKNKEIEEVYVENTNVMINNIKTIRKATYGLRNINQEVDVTDILNKHLCKNRYMYLTPTIKIHGFNDKLTCISIFQNVAKQTNRILLINFKENRLRSDIKDTYNCNLSNIFDFKQSHIICDTNKINEIMLDINSENKIILTRKKCSYDSCLNNVKNLPHQFVFIQERGICNQKLINVHRFFFSSIILNKVIYDYCLDKINSLPKEYSYIQVRCSDRKSDYKKLLREEIKGLKKNIYIATDNKEVIDYARETYKNYNIYNFTEFGNTLGKPLHFSKVDGQTQLRDIICDNSLVFNAATYSSNSHGGFTKLCRNAFNNKNLNFLKH